MVKVTSRLGRGITIKPPTNIPTEPPNVCQLKLELPNPNYNYTMSVTSGTLLYIHFIDLG